MRRADMQNKPKSAEMSVIHWLADYFLSGSFDIDVETNYLRGKAELQSLLEMPKLQRLLPRQQSQPIANVPRRDVWRPRTMTNEEWRAEAIRVCQMDYPKPPEASPAPPDREVQVDAKSQSPNGMLERGSTESPEAPPAPPDGAVHVHEESQSPNTTAQSASGSNTPGLTSCAPICHCFA